MDNEGNQSLYGRYVQSILTITDFLLINVLVYVLVLLNPVLKGSFALREIWLIANLAYIPVAFWQHRLYTEHRAIALDMTMLNGLKAVGVHALFFLASMAILSVDVAKYVYLEFYAMLVVLMPLWWLCNRQLIKAARARGRNSSRVVIVGNNQTARRLAAEMHADAGFGYKIVGYVDDESSPELDEPYLGTIDQLAKFAKEERINEIFFTLSGSRESELSRVIKIADDNLISFYYVPQISRFVRRNFAIYSIGAMPVLTLMRNPLKNSLNRALKRGFDIAFSSVTLLVLGPTVFLPIAIGVKMTSPGPVFFKQKRTGYRGRTFNCLKFRSMRVNKDADNVQATKDDARKTPFGNFLRHTSLDELPQFVNVWLGDMSVVGPRPHMLKHTEQYTRLVDRYMVRHIVRPGITGWAQVNGYRGLTDEVWKMEKRVEYDVWYIEHWNFFLDLKIIARTLINGVAGEKNAF